jgi:acetyl esterase/lipase
VFFIFFYSIYVPRKNEPVSISNPLLARIFSDWKMISISIILMSWGFFILGFSISAYWLREFNLWLGAVLAIVLLYFILRMSFSRYTTGTFEKLPRLHQVSFLSAIILLIVVIFPLFQVNTILPAVSSKETLEFNSNSDLVPLSSRFSPNLYLNGFSLDDPHMVVIKNKRYNNYSALDIYYLPKENTSNPIIIVLHGGGWISGSKGDIPIKSISRFFAIHGFTVFAINYRLYPKVTFLGMLHDVRDAIVFAKSTAEDFQGDKNRVFLFGRSSGAQLALVAAYGSNETFFREQCGNYSYSELKVSGVASIYGISEISSMGSRILGIKSDEDSFLIDLASPISYINRSGMVPTFIAAGSLDTLVPVQNSRALKKALSENNNEYMYLEIPWANHSFDGVISSLSSQLALYFFLTFFSHYT